MNKLLEISQLHIAFDGRKDTVRGASLYIHRGETVGISGASGSGKSLTMWSLLGLLPGGSYSSGSFTYYNAKGVPTDIQSPSQMHVFAGRCITVIPQNPFTSLNPVFHCGVQIAEMLKSPNDLGEPQKDRILRHLENLGFDHPERIYNAYPFELSGGQLQRIVIAMATIGDPELVIADEPTTALDAITQTEVLDLLSGWVKAGNKSMFLVSHDISLLLKYCDRIYAMRNGEIERTGTREEMSEWMRQYSGVEQAPMSQTGDDSQLICSTNALSVTYRGRSGEEVEALREVNLKIHAGEAIGLVGATGCGKSTMAKALTGLVVPRKGTVTFGGHLMDYDQFPEMRRQVQMIFQDPYSALYPHLTISAYLREAIRLYRIVESSLEDACIDQILEQVGLEEELAGRYPHQLSGGQRQRVQIARAVLLKPRLLICDEITSGLDAAIQAQVLQLLKRLHLDTGMALLIISHNLNVIRFMTDYIYVMDAGKVVEEAETQRLFIQPQSPVTKALLAAQNQEI